MWIDTGSAEGEQFQAILSTAQDELTEWVLTDREKVVFASTEAQALFGVQLGMSVSENPIAQGVLESKQKMIQQLGEGQGAKSVVGIPLSQDSGEIDGVLLYSREAKTLEIELVLELLEHMNQEQSLEDALKVMTDRAVNAFNLKVAGVWLWNNRWFQELAISVSSPEDEALAHLVFGEELTCHREMVVQCDKDRVCVYDIHNIADENDIFCSGKERLRQFGVKRVVCIPLRHSGTFLGILGLFSAYPDTFRDQGLSLLRDFALIISSYVYVKQLREAATEREQALNLLLRGTEILVQAESEEQLLTEAGEMTMIFYLEAGFFLMKGEENWRVCAPFGRLRLPEQGRETLIKEYAGLNSLDSYQPNQVPIVKLLDVHPELPQNDFPWSKAVVLPIQTQGEIGGELWLLDYKENQIEHYQEIFAAFTRGMGVALDTIRQRKELEKMAMTDVLTGLLNRKGFELRIHEEVASTNRRNSSFLLLIIDLDGFKGLNDTQGHPAGDSALSQIAANLRASIRQHDIIARTGGDEFTAVLTDLTKANAYAIVERIRNKMGLEEFGLGASIGVAEFPAEAEDYEGLYKMADRRLYFSKHHGKGKIVLDDIIIEAESD